ncbi:MAG: tetratricopeptide repeat protein, partial [Bacteroidota bacterium]
MTGAALCRVFVTLCFGFAFAQSQPASVSEEQDYAFAYGLYEDEMYQLAFDQFSRFVERYPNSSQREESLFLAAECLFSMGMDASALARYRSFLAEYPRTTLSDNATFRIGQV